MTTETTTTKTSKKKAATVEKVGNVIFAKANSERVNAALAELRLKPKGSLAARVEQLNKKFEELNKKQDLYVCEVEIGGCGGDFTEDFDLCPFCGKADEVEDETGSETGGKLAKPPEPLPGKLAKFDDKDLDADVKAIIDLKQQTAICMWDLGAAIKKNYDREFWKLRRNENGGAQYRNVKQFWAQELGISHTYAYSLMEVSKYFSKDDVKKIGTTKLALILRAPERKRAGLLKAAKGGASKADLAKKVRAANASADDAPGAADDGTPRKRRISIAVVPGRKTVKLYAKPKGKDAEKKRAKRMGDMPHGEMMFENGTMMTFRLADKNGEWVAIVEFGRAE